ncbi:MAG: PASTA domain-containing protein [Candidatus Eremiobacteraeota bacterium]|nr:PASTA domain-containing protein [Candidatus Eremiobacteraeota bacterium]
MNNVIGQILKFLVLLFMVGVTLTVIGWVGWTVYTTYLNPPMEVMVPDLSGKSLSDAENTLRSIGLRASVVDQRYSKNLPPNSIISQDPGPNRTVRKGRQINLVISLGTENIPVPDITGKSLRTATIILENAGFRVGEIKNKPDRTKPIGTVLDQHPIPGAPVQVRGKVDLVVNSAGPADFEVPKLTEKQLADARKLILRSNLNIGTITWYWQDWIPPGEVLKQSPSAGKRVSPGTKLDLVVSAGPPNSTLAISQKFFTFTVPKGKDPQAVSVLLSDKMGTYEIYSGEHLSGDKVRILLSAFGPAEVEVKVNERTVRRARI